MRLSFSTLGCPDWSWERVIAEAGALGFEGVEWRLVSGSLVGPGFPVSVCRRIRSAAEQVNLASVALDSSVHLVAAPGSRRDELVAEGLAMIATAAELGTDTMRVFTGSFPPGTSDAQAVEWASETLKLLLPAAEQHRVRLAMETHTFEGRGKNLTGTSDSELCRRIVERLASPWLGILWDVANSLAEGEELGAAWANVRDALAYLHVKDLRPLPSGGWEPELPGAGAVPLAMVVELLRSAGFEGWLSFEWEKKWHPAIPEPEVALPRFIQLARGLLR